VTPPLRRCDHRGLEEGTLRVGLFITCLVDVMRPEIAEATVRLLEAAGCTVEVPMAQTCCGQPGYNSGDTASARDLARKLLAEFERFEHVVLPSESCGGMIRHHYAVLFADDPDLGVRIGALASRTWELTSFLHDVVGMKSLPGRFEGEVTYHDSCSGLRELGVQAQPRALLALQAGVKLVEMQDARACCGFGGTFAVKYGDISTAIVELDDFEGTRDEAVERRDRALANLDAYLERFEAEATRRGATVLWAETPEEASRLVVAIAKKHEVAKVTKSRVPCRVPDEDPAARPAAQAAREADGARTAALARARGAGCVGVRREASGPLQADGEDGLVGARTTRRRQRSHRQSADGGRLDHHARPAGPQRSDLQGTLGEAAPLSACVSAAAACRSCRLAVARRPPGSPCSRKAGLPRAPLAA
jgi:L-lactate dehydrogenase complex protein LldE